jgi:hypothetical protein
LVTSYRLRKDSDKILGILIRTVNPVRWGGQLGQMGAMGGTSYYDTMNIIPCGMNPNSPDARRLIMEFEQKKHEKQERREQQEEFQEQIKEFDEYENA